MKRHLLPGAALLLALFGQQATAQSLAKLPAAGSITGRSVPCVTPGTEGSTQLCTPVQVAPLQAVAGLTGTPTAAQLKAAVPYSAGDVGAVPATSVAQPGGVASLDSTGTLPTGQAYIKTVAGKGPTSGNVPLAASDVGALSASATTDQVAEGTSNRYYTDARAAAAGAQPSTTNPNALGTAGPGTSPKFMRADAVIPHGDQSAASGTMHSTAQIAGFATAAAAAAPVQKVNGYTGTVALGAADVGALPTGTKTDAIAEGTTNLYYTAARAAAAGPQPSTTNPNALGTAGPGTGTTYARADHVHPTTGLVLTTSLGVANGVATLGSDGLIPAAQARVPSVAGLMGAITAANLKTALAIASTDLTDASASGKSVLTGTPAAGRTALGSGTTGDALFTAATPAAAKSTLAIAEADVSVATRSGNTETTQAQSNANNVTKGTAAETKSGSFTAGGLASTGTLSATGTTTTAGITNTGAISTTTLAASGATTVGGTLVVTGTLTSNGVLMSPQRIDAYAPSGQYPIRVLNPAGTAVNAYFDSSGVMFGPGVSQKYRSDFYDASGGLALRILNTNASAVLGSWDGSTGNITTIGTGTFGGAVAGGPATFTAPSGSSAYPLTVNYASGATAGFLAAFMNNGSFRFYIAPDGSWRSYGAGQVTGNLGVTGVLSTGYISSSTRADFFVSGGPATNCAIRVLDTTGATGNGCWDSNGKLLANGLQPSSASSTITNATLSGSFSPTPTGSTSGTASASSSSGVYDVINKRVWISFNVAFTQGTMVGNVQIPLPLASGSVPTGCAIGASNFTPAVASSTNFTGLYFYIPANSSVAVLEYVRSGSAYSPVQGADISATTATAIPLSCSYTTP